MRNELDRDPSGMMPECVEQVILPQTMKLEQHGSQEAGGPGQT
jgi:hypothetical protein